MKIKFNFLLTDGETPLDKAIEKGYLEVVKMLLAHPKQDPPTKWQLESALECCMREETEKRDRKEILRFLLDFPLTDLGDYMSLEMKAQDKTIVDQIVSARKKRIRWANFNLTGFTSKFFSIVG